MRSIYEDIVMKQAKLLAEDEEHSHELAQNLVKLK
jgi:hypothetical protein